MRDSVTSIKPIVVRKKKEKKCQKFTKMFKTGF